MPQLAFRILSVLEFAAEGAALLLQALDVAAETSEVRLEPEEHFLEAGEDEVAFVHVGSEGLDEFVVLSVDCDALVFERGEFGCDGGGVGREVEGSVCEAGFDGGIG